ncbi:response regulator [Leucobacter sp. NPDC058333]|uniref:response regulator n=1 Tax=Leucobacter sp. NPDC058333 TaxID=3346450 RepID=UPI003669A305
MNTAPTVAPSSEAAPATALISVLIADDDPWTTQALALALSSDAELSVRKPVHSGDAAIDAYRNAPADVVLMDLNMPPGMSGVEATKLILREHPNARVMILTTVSPGPGIARALEAGALAAVQKTASERTLRDAIKVAARGDDPVLLKRLAADISVSGDRLPESPAVPPQLTEAELGVLRLICEGLSYDEIAEARNISVWTARTYAKSLRTKLYANSLGQLVVRALQYRFISA